MGMRGNFKLADQVDLPDAYVRVEGVHGTKNGFSARFDVFANKEAADAGKPPLSGMSFDVTYPFVPGLDPLEAAYLRVPHVGGLPALEPILELGQVLPETPEAFKPKQPDPVEKAPAEGEAALESRSE